MSMESKEAKTLIDKVLKSKGFKRVKQGTATRSNPKSLEYKFGEHFVLSASTRVHAAIWTGSFKISFTQSHRALDVMNVASYGWFNSRSYSLDREWNHFDEDGAMRLNEENITKVFEEFLVHVEKKRQEGRENFFRVYSQDTGAFEKRFSTRHLGMLDEWSDNDKDINEVIYKFTEDERFLSDEAKDIFLF